MTRTTAVLLAAGAGTRLGLGPKALLPYRGGTLLAHAARQLLDGGCAEVVVVVGAGAAEVRATPLPPACRYVENPRWQDGMGSSFAAGMAAAGISAAGSGPVLVALVDQPGMTAELVARLIARHGRGRITAAGYNSPFGAEGRGTLRRGNPVLFSPDHAAAAAASATGDSGAREYLAAHRGQVDVVDCTDLGDGADVDTPADMHLLAAPDPAQRPQATDW